MIIMNFEYLILYYRVRELKLYTGVDLTRLNRVPRPSPGHSKIVFALPNTMDLLPKTNTRSLDEFLFFILFF